MRQRTILAALLFHTRRRGEFLGEFREQVRALSDADRAWFAQQFAKEFEYEIVQGAPSTSSHPPIALPPAPKPAPTVEWGYIEL